MTGPISSSRDPEVSALEWDIAAIIDDANRHGTVNKQAMADAQKHIQNLLKDPNIPSSMKQHLKTLMADFDHPAATVTDLNIVDMLNVQKDIHKLP